MWRSRMVAGARMTALRERACGASRETRPSVILTTTSAFRRHLRVFTSRLPPSPDDATVREVHTLGSHSTELQIFTVHIDTATTYVDPSVLKIVIVLVTLVMVMVMVMIMVMVISSGQPALRQRL
ncbi:hypothetical protein EVAR_48354_1 [Eumeta japonica]|uniref:Uncharacterized protein n=1 Tax=Eumeta variegata TaxID=151549 RepID=A0A4C1WJ50_EUMVA|nr:hypothetical protein EVAR_48354_1 [Eumeta japonica]